MESSAPTGARTLERGLGLLDHVAAGRERLEEISAAAGLSRSATHRMLTSLVAARFLEQTPQRTYRLGLKLLELGHLAERTLDLPGEVQAVLTSIADATRDTTHLGVLRGADVLYLAKARGHRGMEMASRVGARLRAQNTAMGKALLAELPEERALAAFDPAAVVTGNSIATAAEFARALRDVRERGFALDDQENELGVRCVAIAVPDLSGRPAAAVSISAPSVHVPQERVAELVGVLRARRAELTARLPRGFATAWT
ncbi:IclR family transcriptional regulator [Kineococcus sp. SYSU DK005]|uniref:IclR family transcriptional regulator n=1 Tax=Kineococcus sp. SYSU DK005 TaxID=3383126 RepID=UPI003D7C68C3